MYFCNYLLSSQNAIPKNSSTSVEFLAALVPDRRTSTASVYNQKNSFHSFFSPPQLPKATFPRLGKEMEERYRMTHYLRYCCAMLFALFSFLLATPLSAQAQTREAYVAQSEDKTTLTFYYDALRATRTGTTWGIGEMQQERENLPTGERENLPRMGRNMEGDKQYHHTCGVRCVVPRFPSHHHRRVVLSL